jgi:delta-aminolevulinic acid dehydratase/porphobilinogen synthase
MLTRRGIESVMTFGAEQDKPVEEVGTHAWLDAGNVRVSGYPLALTHSPFVAYLLS